MLACMALTFSTLCCQTGLLQCRCPLWIHAPASWESRMQHSGQARPGQASCGHTAPVVPLAERTAQATHVVASVMYLGSSPAVRTPWRVRGIVQYKELSCVLPGPSV